MHMVNDHDAASEKNDDLDLCVRIDGRASYAETLMSSRFHHTQMYFS
jgi:hypothetical protein